MRGIMYNASSILGYWGSAPFDVAGSKCLSLHAKSGGFTSSVTTATPTPKTVWPCFPCLLPAPYTTCDANLVSIGHTQRMRVGLCVCNMPGADLRSVKMMKEFQKHCMRKKWSYNVMVWKCIFVLSHFWMLLKANGIWFLLEGGSAWGGG